MKLLLILVSLIVSATAHEVTTRELRCEYHHNPLAIGTTQPRFSWKIQPIDPAARDVRQVAYEIQCAHEADGFAKNCSGAQERLSQPQPIKSSMPAPASLRGIGSSGASAPGKLAEKFLLGVNRLHLASDYWSKQIGPPYGSARAMTTRLPLKKISRILPTILSAGKLC